MNRVVITGVGPVSNIGTGKDEFWNNLISGKTNISKIDFEGYDMSQYRSKFAGLVNDFDFDGHFGKFPHRDQLGRTSKFALVGTKYALDDANISLKDVDSSKEKYTMDDIDSDRASVILGVGGPIFDVIDENFIGFIKHNGPCVFSRHMVANISNASPPAHITRTYDLHSDSHTVTAACASTNLALIEAYQRITLGLDDVIISGGADAFITPSSFGGFDRMRVLATNFSDDPNKAYRPFDKDRSGMILAESAGILVLESLDHALERGADIYCELLQGSSKSDGYHIYRPESSGKYMVKAMSNTLDINNLTPKDIDYINAHGSSTILNDSIESKAIKEVFGKEAYNIPVSSTKSMHAHSVGASGGLEAIAVALSIYNSKIPPTVNLDNPDYHRGCDLDYVPNVARDKEVNYALSNSFGFGGINSTLAFKKFER